MFQDRIKDVPVGSRWFSSLYILSPNFQIFFSVHRRLAFARSIKTLAASAWNEYKGGPNSVSKNHVNFRCKKRTPKLASCTFLSWLWQPFPFYFKGWRPSSAPPDFSTLHFIAVWAWKLISYVFWSSWNRNFVSNRRLFWGASEFPKAPAKGFSLRTAANSSQPLKTFFQLLQTNVFSSNSQIPYKTPTQYSHKVTTSKNTTNHKNKRKSIAKLFHAQTGSIWFQISSYLVPMGSLVHRSVTNLKMGS